MEAILIEETEKTPFIKIDTSQGLVEIKGRSHPENAREFYKVLLDWGTMYSKNPREKTIIHIQFEHFNSSSSKCLLDFFKILEPIQLSNHDVIVNWHYEKYDEDMLEAGETYQSLLHFQFNMIGI